MHRMALILGLAYAVLGCGAAPSSPTPDPGPAVKIAGATLELSRAAGKDAAVDGALVATGTCEWNGVHGVDELYLGPGEISFEDQPRTNWGDGVAKVWIGVSIRCRRESGGEILSGHDDRDEFAVEWRRRGDSVELHPHEWPGDPIDPVNRLADGPFSVDQQGWIRSFQSGYLLTSDEWADPPPDTVSFLWSR